jgi:hypothetical protein
MKQAAQLIAITTILAVAPTVLAGCRGENTKEDEDAYEHVMSFDTARVRRACERRDPARNTIRPEQKTWGSWATPSDDPACSSCTTAHNHRRRLLDVPHRIPLDITFADSAGVIEAFAP